MSDLQCPARFVIACPDAAGDPSALRQQAAALAQTVRADRVAHVWTAPDRSCRMAADVVAEHLGVGVTVDVELDEERGTSVGALCDLADLHRGETVLVVTVAAVLRRLDSGEASTRRLIRCALDADGLVVTPEP